MRIELKVLFTLAALVSITVIAYYSTQEEVLHVVRLTGSSFPVSFKESTVATQNKKHNTSATASNGSVFFRMPLVPSPSIQIATSFSTALAQDTRPNATQDTRPNAIIVLRKSVQNSSLENTATSKSTTDPPITFDIQQPAPKQASGPGLGSSRRGYILTLTYTGQQSAGLRGIMSQQCWAASFNLPMTIVEPFGINSSLCNRAKAWTTLDRGEPLTRFSDYFDIIHFNQHAIAAGNPPLVSWEEFLHKAPRKVIVVYINGIQAKNCLGFKSGCSHWRRNEKEVNAFTSNCTVVRSVDSALEYLQMRQFEVVRTVCLKCGIWKNASPQLSPSALTMHIFGKYKPAEVTILFDLWKFTLSITPHCRHSPKCHMNDRALTTWTQPSLHISQAADLYLKSTLGTAGNRTVAIMVRLEWYLIYMRQKTRIGVCLKEIEGRLDMLRKSRINLNEHAPPFLAMDVGKYGSGTFPTTLRIHSLSQKYFDSTLEQVRSFVARIYDQKWTFQDWENSFSAAAKAYPDRGFIAALQSTIASKADCLLLLGGGHFQELALKLYKKAHPIPSKQCIYYICMAHIWQSTFLAV